jgi:2'-5' RNA ligase
MRLFLALDLPADIAAAVEELCTDLPGARWSNLAQLHLTLRFLGEVSDGAVPALRAQLAAVKRPGFELSLRGVGVFPPRRRPARVLWAGVTPEEPAVQLKAAIDQALGPDAEAAEHAFSPHLTLARFRDDPGPALARYLTAHAGFASAAWRADLFHLYRSTLGRDGATHEIVQSYALAG